MYKRRIESVIEIWAIRKRVSLCKEYYTFSFFFSIFVKNKNKNVSVETRIPRQGRLSVTQTDFREMIQPKAGHL